MKISNHFYRTTVRASFRILGCCGILLLSILHAQAQTDKRMIRIAQIEVDSTQLKQYNAALKEQMQTAVRLEPGVLTYYAVADKKDPSRITILEIYADSAAYLKHIATPHFKKYKATVAHMVKKLELVDVNLIGSAKQHGL
ncbi:antibiotic biosynthesis monooxygenase [Mucilaginibacter sp. BJC16-A38]|uniref:putative quinol monooxygenase n=1 Tax=Mucilaginibacter phenanthrenivorans TaxID=1234842 RepID=UPI00215887B9|nr:putative quinol monooxygenase [Mucilaginibacter phenanthrenivorans]MCR8560041.1 antibiotic biosynthesis monooxygenase [Mucilaginibacter phenanthrenivorans]